LHNFPTKFLTVWRHVENRQFISDLQTVLQYIGVCVSLYVDATSPYLRILLQLFTAPGTMEVPRVRVATVQVNQVMHTNGA
jgi:hypothetical protein